MTGATKPGQMPANNNIPPVDAGPPKPQPPPGKDFVS